MGAVKTFLMGSAKLALALVAAMVLLIGGIWGYSSWQAHKKQLQEAPLATKKQWPTQHLLSNLPVDVATAWRDGQTRYQVSISKYSDLKYNRLPNASITLEFKDRDGFKLWEKEIKWNEMTGVTGADGTGIEGFSWAGNEYASADDYARAGDLYIVWRGLTAKAALAQKNIFRDLPLPKQPTVPATGWRVLGNWRKLAVGQNEETVRGLLGEPTNVTRYGATLYNWRYGDLIDGGEVSFTKGAVASWREPSR